MRHLLWALPALASVGCSWARFDDVVENAPIVVLDKPKDVSSGFGTSLATSSAEDKVTLLVGGSPLVSGAAAFDLGTSDSPVLGAIDTAHCSHRDGDKPCFLSSTPVALPLASTPGMNRPNCFVDGAGTAPDGTGLVVRCADEVEYALAIPEAANKLLEFDITNNQPDDFHLGVDKADAPALLASVPITSNGKKHGVVWYYPPLKRTPIELEYPGEDRAPEDFGRTLAIARVGEGRLIAAGGNASGEVRLYLAEDSKTPHYIGCLGGTTDFGRALATGPVLPGDDDDELVVSDASQVFVFDAAALAQLVPTADSACSLSSLPEGSLISSFTCGSTKNISGCESSQFGFSLGVGDLDGDGDGEVVVGAPAMTVRHVDRGGALIIYDVEERGDSAFKDIAFISSVEQDDQLGTSLALPNLGKRSIIAAGAPGNSKVALFYCPSFLPAELAGARCNN